MRDAVIFSPPSAGSLFDPQKLHSAEIQGHRMLATMSEIEYTCHSDRKDENDDIRRIKGRGAGGQSGACRNRRGAVRESGEFLSGAGRAFGKEGLFYRDTSRQSRT